MKEFFKSHDMIPISIGRFFFEIDLKVKAKVAVAATLLLCSEDDQKKKDECGQRNG